MKWTPEEFKANTVLSAVLPYDDQQNMKDLFKNCSGYEGIAVLPSFIKFFKENDPQELPCHIIGLSGYPTGGATTKTKISEIRDLYYLNVDRFEITVNTGFILSGLWEEVECDLSSATRACGGRPLVVSLELAYMQQSHIQKLCEICENLEVEAVSSTTGWLPQLPNIDQMRFLRQSLNPKIKMQAAGILSYEQFSDAVQAGAERFMIRRQHAEAILAQIPNN